MGKFKTCAITLKERKEVFRDGELVAGVMMLDVLEPVTVKGVRVYCYGKALTKWSKEFSRDWDSDQIGTEKYFGQVQTVFGRRANEEGPNQTLSVGQHRWNFAFRLPTERLPSSFEGEYGAIRWFLKVEVDRPSPSPNNEWFSDFTVLSHLDINEAVYKSPMSKTVTKTVSKGLGIGNAGSLTLTVKTDRYGYCPGERIVLNVEAKNDSSKDLGKINVSLVQHVVYTANDENRTTDFGVSALETELSLAKGTTMTLTDLLLPIPAVPPSTRKRTYQIITCSYNVTVTVRVPWSLDLEAALPVAIGTVPLGKRVPPPRQTAVQAAANPATNMQYVKCETGISPCRKSHNNFPNLSCTPCTVFVSDYQFKPSATAPTAAAAAVPTAPAQPQPQPQPQPAASPATVAKAEEAKAHVPSPVPGGVVVAPSPLPPYSPANPSAPSMEEMEAPPPSYEDVLKMDEQNQASKTSGAGAVPKGKPCSLLVIRFPDAHVTSFRDCIQREQNNLLDSEEAFLAVFSPQPITSIIRPYEGWPERHAVAVLVFPNTESGEEWMKSVQENSWYSSCDAFIMPGDWNIPENASERIFAIGIFKTKEGSTKEQIMAFSKNVQPLIIKLRVENGGLREATTKKTKMLHGRWVTPDQTVALSNWPKLTNYFQYAVEFKKGEFVEYMEAFRALFESNSLLLVSEDVTSLSTQSTQKGDDLEGDDNDNNDENTGEDIDDDDKSEKLLVSDDKHVKHYVKYYV